MHRKTVLVRDKMQSDYRYDLVEPEGQNFDSDFRPELSPPRCSISGSSAAST